MNANENNNALHEEAVHEIPAVPSASSDDEGNGRVDVNVNAGGDEKNGVREQQHVRNINNNVQETNTYHTPNNAQMFHHQNPPNNTIMYANNNNNGPQFQPPAYGCYGPPSSMANNMASFPYAAQPHNSLPPNLPQILAPPPTLPIPPPTLNNHNNVGLDAQRQYYEAQMRE